MIKFSMIMEEDITRGLRKFKKIFCAISSHHVTLIYIGLLHIEVSCLNRGW